MHVRVVRFTGVSAESINRTKARIEAEDGPPTGVQTSGLTVMFDEDQGTAVVLQSYATKADLDAGARVLSAMDPSETPGARVSVDSCEVVLELKN
jgi:hypothetical protein